MADYGEMFYGTLPQDTQDMDAVLRGVGRSLRDIGRGVSYYPYDLIGAPVDLINMALTPVGLGSEEPVMGSDYLRNIARSLGLAEAPTGSGAETAARFAAGFTNPASGARAVGRASDLVTRGANVSADKLVQMITQNPEATAPQVLEAAGQMLPMSRMISPEIAARFLPETKVVDEAGKPLVVYHGTPDAFESSIRGESYFSPDPEIAEIYTSPSASSIATSAKRGDAPAVYPSYLEIKKPFDTRDPKIRKEFMEEYYGKYGNRTPLSDSGLPDWTEARDLREWIEETGKNYDGLILDEGGLSMPDGTVKSRGISYVPFDSGQIKSAVSDPQMAGLLDQPAQSVVETSYRGSHSAPNAETYGATLDSLEGIMPADVYSSRGKRLYGLGNPDVDAEWFAAAFKAKGKPDAEVTVYRAVPKGVKEINSGDWVTTSKTYADMHGENTVGDEYEILSKKVKAKTLSSEGYPYEFGYNE
jgi:hypothetical protein